MILIYCNFLLFRPARISVSFQHFFPGRPLLLHSFDLNRRWFNLFITFSGFQVIHLSQLMIFLRKCLFKNTFSFFYEIHQ